MLYRPSCLARPRTARSATDLFFGHSFLLWKTARYSLLSCCRANLRRLNSCHQDCYNWWQHPGNFFNIIQHLQLANHPDCTPRLHWRWCRSVQRKTFNAVVRLISVHVEHCHSVLYNTSSSMGLRSLVSDASIITPLHDQLHHILFDVKPLSDI